MATAFLRILPPPPPAAYPYNTRLFYQGLLHPPVAYI